MKTIKNILKSSTLAKLSALFAIAFVANVFSMRMTPQQMERAKGAVKRTMGELKQQQVPIQPMTTEAEQKQELEEAFMSDTDYAIAQQVKNLKPGEFFIYQGGTADGIVVPWSVLQKSSTMKAMVEDMEAQNGQIAIPITTCPIATIQLVFNALATCTNEFNDTLSLDTLTRDIKSFLLEKLVEMANAFTFFEVPQEMLTVVVVKIKIWMESNSEAIVSNKALKILNPDLQKVLMLESSVNCLKDCIIKKYAKNRSKSLVGHPDDVNSVAFSPDGTKIVSGCFGDQDNLILWDISDPHNIVHQTLVGHPNNVRSVAFSPDGTKIVSGGSGDQNNLILWDISNPHNIVFQPLVGHPDSVLSVAFSRDGTKIISGSWSNQNNLILWDISNPQNITKKTLVANQITIWSVAFSPDDKRIVLGALGDQDNLILWDISNPNNIVHQPLVGHPKSVTTVAFNHDGTKIVSGSDSNHNNLILWDISNPHNIVHQPLVGNPGGVYSVAFSRDGTNIVSGCEGNQNNLILWDISNPHNIVHQTLVGHPNNVRSVAFSPDGTKIVSGCKGNQNNLILWTLLTDQENTLLKQLKNYTPDQIRLIYQLCLQSSKGQKIALKEGSEEHTIFMTLPQDMQRLLIDLLSIKITHEI